MDIITYLQVQKLIEEAKLKALDRMNSAEMFGLMIMVKAGIAEIDRQIDELIGSDIL